MVSSMPPAGAEEGGLGQWHLLLVSHDLTRRDCGREIFWSWDMSTSKPRRNCIWQLMCTLKTEWDTIKRAACNMFRFPHWYPHWWDPEWSGTLSALVRLYLGNRAQVEQKPSSHLKRKLVKISKCCGFSQSSDILTDVSLVNSKCLRKNYCVEFFFFICLHFCLGFLCAFCLFCFTCSF